MKFVKTPKLLQWIFPKRTWVSLYPKNKVFLTFDDGPIPEVTPWVLDELKKHNAKASFFSIGDNIEKHPEIFKRILCEGHTVGNHSFNHLNGWHTKTSKYIENVMQCEASINLHYSPKNRIKLFRPPYGKMTSKQARILQQKGFEIIMWSVLSYDYHAEVSKEKCLVNVLENLKPGNIIVFHDSLKAEENLRYVLPKVLESIANNKKLAFGKLAN